MNVNKVYCLFEQSGTFKNIFLKKGINTIDIDIDNQFNETDLIIDLFKCIDKLPNGYLAQITKDDLIIAFFPCTWFSDYNALILNGKWKNFKNWNDFDKNRYIEKRRRSQRSAANLLIKLIRYCKFNEIPLIIENPYSQYIINLLGKPNIKHNRNIYGDIYKKPTVWYTYNCTINEDKMIKYNSEIKDSVENKRGIERSLIYPIYAENLINAIEIIK